MSDPVIKSLAHLATHVHGRSFFREDGIADILDIGGEIQTIRLGYDKARQRADIADKRVEELEEVINGKVHYELSKQFESTDPERWPLRPRLAWEALQAVLQGESE